MSMTFTASNGLRLTPDGSTVIIEGDPRSGLCGYQGTLTPDEVVAFREYFEEEPLLRRNA